MRFSNILRLSALFSTVAVQVTAAQFNVTVGGPGGIKFSPEFVVSDVEYSGVWPPLKRRFPDCPSGRCCGLHLPTEKPHRHPVYFRQPLPAQR